MNIKFNNFGPFCMILLTMFGCQKKTEPIQTSQAKIRIITLDPGHFHAALLQKSMYDDIDSVVHVYAPDGPEVVSHMKLVESYNTRAENPTNWKMNLYKGNDYLEKMFQERAGNVVIISGNNHSKSKYIKMAIDSGFNVLADKPLAIDKEGFQSLERSFEIAQKKNLLLYDIMTERYNIYYILQRELSQDEAFFGNLEKGSIDDPAVVQQSVHHFYKKVSGKPLTRPVWYFDVEQEGHGLVDITTHMVDLIQWGCFPNLTLDYKKDVKMLSAKEWPTRISQAEFLKSTSKSEFPEFLKKYVKNNKLEVFANGEMNYTLKDVHARVSVQWNFESPEGTGDTHFSQMRGTKANILIKQGKEQAYKPVVYIDPLNSSEEAVQDAVKRLGAKYPGLSLKRSGALWEVVIPEKFKVGHEDHFAEVAKKYLEYLKSGELPAWEVPNMLTKYYTTTQALEMARKK